MTYNLLFSLFVRVCVSPLMLLLVRIIYTFLVTILYYLDYLCFVV